MTLGISVPLWLLYTNHYHESQKLLQKPPVSEIVASKTKFCNFIYSNPNCKQRNDFFHKLSKYKQVDAGGKVFNNLGFQVKNKTDFISQYKFSFAFENTSYPGYTTEKIFEPMLVQSIPIYWGNPLVGRDFNSNSFVNCHDFRNDEEIIERIVEIDKHIDKYVEILNEPFFNNNIFPSDISDEKIVARFQHIFNLLDSPYQPISLTWKKHYRKYRKLREDLNNIYTSKLKFRK